MTVRTINNNALGMSLVGLDNALYRANLWDALDHAPNVTCLAPDSKAFLKAGSPELNLPPAELANALLFHTLPMPLYSDFLDNVTVMKSLSNDTVVVRLKEDGIYFNDAKVIAQNVL